jgi:hypothetical protein
MNFDISDYIMEWAKPHRQAVSPQTSHSEDHGFDSWHRTVYPNLNFLQSHKTDHVCLFPSTSLANYQALSFSYKTMKHTTGTKSSEINLFEHSKYK